MSDELTEFERRLAQLQPRSLVDRDQILFSAGQASVSCTPRPADRVWKILATCSTVAALLLMVALGLTRQSLSDSRHRVLVLQDTLQQGSAPRAGQQATTEGRWPRLAETSLPDDELVANLPASSPFMWRRTNLNMAPSRRSPIASERSRSTPLSMGETRRIVAMVDADHAGWRSIDALIPQ